MSRLTHEPIDAGALAASVNRADCGAVVTFLGTVREITGNERTAALEYDAYPEMADKVLDAIEADARKRWPIRAVTIVHRLGKLEPGIASVGIAVACPHRGDAFDACRYIMDRIKAEAPIWKRDHTPDGSASWVHPGVTS